VDRILRTMSPARLRQFLVESWRACNATAADISILGILTDAEREAALSGVARPARRRGDAEELETLSVQHAGRVGPQTVREVAAKWDERSAVMRISRGRPHLTTEIKWLAKGKIELE